MIVTCDCSKCLGSLWDCDQVQVRGYIERVKRKSKESEEKKVRKSKEKGRLFSKIKV